MDALTALGHLTDIVLMACPDQHLEEARQYTKKIRGELVAAQRDPLVVNLPLVIPPAPADLGRFELSAYHVGITRHEVAAAALDRIMARDFGLWGHCERPADHAKRAALEAWSYANNLFDVGHVTEEQPS